MLVVAARRSIKSIFAESSNRPTTSYVVHLCRAQRPDIGFNCRSTNIHTHTNTLTQLPSNASHKLNKQNVRVFRVFATTPLFYEMRQPLNAIRSQAPQLWHPTCQCYLHYFLIRYEISIVCDWQSVCVNVCRFAPIVVYFYRIFQPFPLNYKLVIFEA